MYVSLCGVWWGGFYFGACLREGSIHVYVCLCVCVCVLGHYVRVCVYLCRGQFMYVYREFVICEYECVTFLCALRQETWMCV